MLRPAASEGVYQLPDPYPWERRAELGVWSAVLETARAVLLWPHRVFDARPRERSAASAVLFGAALALALRAHAALWQLAALDDTRAQLEQVPFARQLGLLTLASPGAIAAGIALAPLLFLVRLYGTAALGWLALRAVGGAKRPFGELVRALAYLEVVEILGAPIYLFMLLPAEAGGPLTTLATLAFFALRSVYYVIALSSLQRIHPLRTLAAVSVFGLLASIALCVSSAALLWWAAHQIVIPL